MKAVPGSPLVVESATLSLVGVHIRCPLDRASDVPYSNPVQGRPRRRPPALRRPAERHTPVYDCSVNDEATNERSAPTLTMVRSHRDAILRAAHSRGVSNIRIFGSVARGDATPASDVDLLVDFERGRRGLDLFAFAREVEDLLGYPVEVGTGLDEVVRSRVEPQLVSL